MNTERLSSLRSSTLRQLRHFQIRSGGLKLWQRIDILLLAFVTTAIAAVIFFWWGVTVFGMRAGWFDAPLLAPLADGRRIPNGNLRDTISDNPLQDGVWYTADGALWISQSGGTVHRYDPATGLWETETPFSPDHLRDPTLSRLRAGCGNESLTTIETSRCPKDDVLWAVTTLGGLATRQEEWQLWVGDSLFTAPDGTPVQHDALTAAAVSTDNRYLVLGTAAQGVGLYDIPQGRWLDSDALRGSSGTLAVREMVSWRGAFWIGTNEGLYRLEIEEETAAVAPVTNGEGSVLDIAADEATGLWVLSQRPCDEVGTDCLYLAKWESPDDGAIVLVDQQNIYADLSLDTLTFAYSDGGLLVVAGEDGIFTYDTRFHRWAQIFDQPIVATTPLPEEDGFYFGFPAGVGRFRGTAIETTWELANEQIRQLVADGANGVLALTNDGDVYGMENNEEEVNRLFTRGDTQNDPAGFTLAIPIGDTVLFTGEEGGTLHHVIERSYRDIAADDLPEWLRNPTSRVLNVDGFVYVLSPRPNESVTDIFVAPQSLLRDPGSYPQAVRTLSFESVEGPVESAWTWENEGIGLIDANGNVRRVVSDTNETLVLAAPEVDGLDFQDVAGVPGELHVLANGQLWRYDLNAHTWDNNLALPASAIPDEELVSVGDTTWAQTQDGRLVVVGNDPRYVLGDGERFAFEDGAISDALAEGSALYVAGSSTIQRYDMTTRSYETEWESGGSGSIRLKTIVNERPIAQQGDVTSWGDTVIGEGVRTTTVSSEGIWMVRDGGVFSYWQEYALKNGTETCFFRNPTPGTGITTIVDARVLPNGLFATMTDGGLAFYDPTYRTWFGATGNIAALRGQLHLVDDYLFVVSTDENTVQLGWIDADTIDRPDSCAVTAIQVEGEVRSALAATVDESGGRVAWLTDNRAIVTWNNGQSTTALPAPTNAPAPDTLRRFYERSDYWLFTTDSQIWRYTPDDRQWQALPLIPDSTITEAITDINIEPYPNNRDIATVLYANGDIYEGVFLPASDEINLEQKYLNGNRFGSTAATLLDVVEQGDIWFFLSNDTLRYFYPSTRIWAEPIGLGTSDNTLTFGQAVGRWVLTGNGGQRWWVAQDSSSTPDAFATIELSGIDASALDEDGTVWQLGHDGQLRQCTATNRQYQCAPAGSSPFLISGTTVQKAIPWRNRLIFFMQTGARIFREDDYSEQTSPPDLASFQNLREAFTFQNALWLYNGAQLVRLSEAISGGMEAVAFNGVTAWTRDDTNHLWARFGGEWRLWNDSSFETFPLNSAFLLTGVQVRAYISAGGVPLGLDNAGNLYDATNNGWLPKPVPLPNGLRSDSVDTIIQGRNETWWIQSGNSMIHLRESSCPPPPTLNPAPRATATIATTATVTATATATITPLPTPTLPPLCWQELGRASLPFANPIVAAEVADVGDITVATGFRGENAYRIFQGAGGTYQAQGVTWQRPLPDEVADVWAQRRANMVTLTNGQTAYNALTGFTVQNQRLLVVRPTGTTEVARRGATQITPVQPLNVQWLRWERASQSFVVATPNGTTTIPKNQFIINGQLLFEPISALLPDGNGHRYAATPTGIWDFPGESLRLNQAAIRYLPLTLPSPIVAAHGVFRAGRNEITPANGNSRPAQVLFTRTIGDVEVSEQIGARTVSATYQLNGTSANAFSATGWVWDANRRALSYQGGTLWLDSDAGLHPYNALRDFNRGPASTAALASLQSESANNLYRLTDDNWFQFQNGNWSRVPNDPRATRSLVRGSGWEWELDNGRFISERNGDLIPFGGTLGIPAAFASDRLRAAAAYDGRLYVVTDQAFEQAPDSTILANGTTSRSNPIGVERLETARFANGTIGLYRYDGTQSYRWQNGQFTPISAGDDPEASWTVVETNRLRFTRQGSKVTKQIFMEAAGAAASWQPFSLDNGRFPFDTVTSLASLDDTLYIGTPLGLQVYERPGTWGVDSLSAYYRLEASPTAVERVGVPVSQPERLMARSTQGCIVRQGTQPFAPCDDASPLDERLRLRNSNLWQWEQHGATGAVGYYEVANGQLDPTPIQVRAGLLPHDALATALVCDGATATLWDNGWATRYATSDLTLQGGNLHYNLPAQGIEMDELLCLPDTVTGVAAGLYGLGDDEVWFYDSANWQPVADTATIATLRERITRPPIYEESRWRLFTPPVIAPVVTPTLHSGFVFEQRTQAGEWQAVPWGEGRVQIDTWQGIVLIEGQLWASTPTGLVAFSQLANDRYGLDPSTVPIVREPTREALACTITDLEWWQAELWVRCNHDSGQVYRGTLTLTQDTGLFQLESESDPFAERLLVDRTLTPYWEWRRTGRVGGATGQLEGVLLSTQDENSEAIGLTAGQFTFDTLNSITLFESDWLELGTNAGGWFRAPRGSIPVADFRRAERWNVTPENGLQVQLTKSTDTIRLCVEQNNADGYWVLAADSTVEAVELCPEWLGDDPLWRYTRLENALVVPSPHSLGGIAERRLVDGRFSDDVVMGLPITTAQDANSDTESVMFHLVPTSAGVMQFAETGIRTAIHAPPFRGLAEGQTPSVLWVANGIALYSGTDGNLYELEGGRMSRFALPASEFSDVVITAIEPGPYEWVRVRWQSGNGAGWTYVEPPGFNTLFRRALQIEVSELPKFIERRGEWGNPAPWLGVRWFTDRVEFVHEESSNAYSVALPPQFALITVVAQGDEIFIVGEKEVLVANLESALLALFE